MKAAKHKGRAASKERLSQCEWDFRQVEDLALPFATVWEYARTSDSIRKSVLSWLDDRAKGKCTLNTDGIEACGDVRLFELVLRRGDFPKPWMAAPIRYERNKKFSRVHCRPLKTLIGHVNKYANANKHTNVIQWLSRVWGDELLLRVDWRGNSVEEILADVERYLRREAANHPERKRAGKRSQAPTYPLKCLAALRLSEAGLAFDAAQDMLVPHHDGGRVLPIFAEKSGWHEAIQRARAELLKPIRYGEWFLFAPE